MEKKWTLREADSNIATKLQSQLNIHPILCKLLVEREITNFDEAKIFFRGDASELNDPFLMKGMNIAIDRITEAIFRKEKILIYGDYDVDGTTSVAVVYSFFKNFHEEIEFYIPHRFREGYGVSQNGIDYAIENDFKLIITLDCGIKSTRLIDYAKQNGIDVIVCDHHLPDDDLPNAIAILNPKQNDCPYPYKELCGCGIGYKLITAYSIQHDIDIHLANEHIDLVATAIAADIVPITGENRILTVLGLKKANTKPSISIQAIKNISELKKELNISDLVFIIAPRVNAAGRMDDARKAVQLFIEKDYRKALDLAAQLQSDNKDRKDVDKLTTKEALEILLQKENNNELFSTVVFKEDWHKGVVGIVASRLIEQYYRPTIVLTESNGMLTGSARSIKGFNLFEGLSQCEDLLVTYGGHYFAAGLTLERTNLELFEKRFEQVVSSVLTRDMLNPEIEIDAEINFNEITPTFLNILKQFAPHGPQNMRPLFITKNVTNFNHFSRILKEVHVKYIMKQSDVVLEGIGFFQHEKFPIVESGLPFDILFHIEENEWNGKTNIQLQLIDIRQSE